MAEQEKPEAESSPRSMTLIESLTLFALMVSVAGLLLTVSYFAWDYHRYKVEMRVEEVRYAAQGGLEERRGHNETYWTAKDQD